MTDARFVDVHILHPVPYSNLNRDDLGTPKQTVYGGTSRARISSQCLKRAARLWIETNTELAAAYRTRRLPEITRQTLIDAGWTPQDAWAAVWEIFRSVGISVGNDDGTARGDQLTFTTGDAADALAGLAIEHKETVLASAEDAGFKAPTETDDGEFPKKDAKPKPHADVEKASKAVFGAVNPVIALAGRMLADLPGTNVDGALQVAHSFTTHTAGIEPDYFTAVDDFNTSEETGAGHINAAEFTSGVFYRYATIDLHGLAGSLGENTDLAPIIAAFLEAFVLAEPTGKQHSTAAHTLPNLVTVSVRSDRPVSLAAAFESPVAAESSGGYTQPSAQRLSDHAAAIETAYGDRGKVGTWHLNVHSEQFDGLGERCDSLEALIEATVGAVTGP